MPLTLYRIKSGRYARMENGKRVEYKVGSTIVLDDAEAKKIAGLVEKVVVPAVSAPMRAAIPPENAKSTSRFSTATPRRPGTGVESD